MRLRAAPIPGQQEGRPDARHVWAELDLLRGATEWRCGSVALGSEWLSSASLELGHRDPATALHALTEAGLAQWHAGDLRWFDDAWRFAVELTGAPASELPPADAIRLQFLDALSAEFNGRHQEAVDSLRRLHPVVRGVRDPAILTLATASALAAADNGLAYVFSSRAIAAARAAKTLSVIPQLVALSIFAELWTGRYPSMTGNAHEGLQVARHTGQHNCESHILSMLALGAAVGGEDDLCLLQAKRALVVAQSNGVGLAVAIARWALALTELHGARSALAASHLGRLQRPVAGAGHPAIALFSTPHFVEAAARAGRPHDASMAVDRFESWAINSARPELGALAARCRALLSVGLAAEEHFRASLDLHRDVGSPFEFAYTETLYAAFLHRGGRRPEARARLRHALNIFQSLNMPVWSVRAHSRLLNLGDRGTDRAPNRTAMTAQFAAGELTAQQLTIARHILSPASSREVGEQLCLSPRTVTYHLTNIFTRLGVHSRQELAALLGPLLAAGGPHGEV